MDTETWVNIVYLGKYKQFITARTQDVCDGNCERWESLGEKHEKPCSSGEGILSFTLKVTESH